MQCPRCNAENREGRRFCGECGLSFASACPACGFRNDGSEKFCGGCGRSLVSPAAVAEPKFRTPQSYTPQHLAEKILTSKAALEGERKQVTVLFADLKGSMELLADRDPEEARKLLDPVLEHMMEAVHRYEGTVNQVMGDGIMALFGAPLAHEDHAVRACYAALRMQESVKKYAEDVRRSHAAVVKIRVGLNSGEVVVRAIGSDLHMDYTAVGQTTHLAARMEQIADPGAIVSTPETLALSEGYVEVKSLGPVPVKGLADAVEVYEVTGAGPARTRLQAATRRGLTRFVGRDAELEQLRRAQQLAGNGHGQVAAIVGEAGVGKSRLVYEFTHSHRIHGWLTLESASVSYGKATSYLPVIDLLKGYFKIQDRDDLREARERPLLVIFEDLHWIEDAGPARRAGGEPRVGALAAARELSSRVPTPLEQPNVLQPAAFGRAAGGEHRGAPGGAPGRRSRAGAAQAAPRQAREPVLPGGDHPNPGRDEGAGGGARPVSADATHPDDPGPPHGPSDVGGAHRPAGPGGQTPPPGWVRTKGLMMDGRHPKGGKA
jgi:class 3 adenylate cyclase